MKRNGAMDQKCVVIGDESACFAYLHFDELGKSGVRKTKVNPLSACARSTDELTAFNVYHPLFGGPPVDVIVGNRSERRRADSVICHLCSSAIPDGAFVKLRNGLYLISPEFTFARMANGHSLVQLAELGSNLCARYYLDGERVADRRTLLTTPARLSAFLARADGLRGRTKAAKALRWVLPNSGSPMETKMQLQFRVPLWSGGMALPFDAMNYDVSAGRQSGMMSQSRFCIDLVSLKYRVGLEYDGEDFHQDASKDKRRLNSLRALRWEVFPIDKAVLFDAEETERAAFQIAKYMHIRIQKPRCWEAKFATLRKDLGLPA